MSERKAELQRLAEEAVYSAKGHFKTADWIGLSVAAYITVPLLTSLAILIFAPVLWLEKLLAFFGAAFSVLALASAWAYRSDKARSAVKSHMNLGNKYLELFKRMRQAWSLDELQPEQISEFREELSALDHQTSKLPISLVGRYWAKWTISSEVDMDWLK